MPSGRCYRALSTRTTRHRNSFFSQAIHLMNTWHLTWNTQHYYSLFIHHTYLFFISNVHILDLYAHNGLYYILCVFAFFAYCILPICILLFYYLCLVLLLSFCSTVELLSLWQIPHMCKHTWPIKLILIIIKLCHHHLIFHYHPQTSLWFLALKCQFLFVIFNSYLYI